MFLNWTVPRQLKILKGKLKIKVLKPRWMIRRLSGVKLARGFKTSFDCNLFVLKTKLISWQTSIFILYEMIWIFELTPELSKRSNWIPNEVIALDSPNIRSKWSQKEAQMGRKQFN